MNSQEVTLLAIKVLFSLLAVVLVGLYMVRPLLRNLLSRPELPGLDMAQIMPVEELEEEIQIPEGGAKPDNFSLIEQARDDPQRTAMLVSGWLREKK